MTHKRPAYEIFIAPIQDVTAGDTIGAASLQISDKFIHHMENLPLQSYAQYIQIVITEVDAQKEALLKSLGVKTVPVMICGRDKVEGGPDIIRQLQSIVKSIKQRIDGVADINRLRRETLFDQKDEKKEHPQMSRQGHDDSDLSEHEMERRSGASAADRAAAEMKAREQRAQQRRGGIGSAVVRPPPAAVPPSVVTTSVDAAKAIDSYMRDVLKQG